jgi:hypothetical protein
VIVKVIEKKEVTPAELTAGRQQLREELLNERKSRFFTSYMTKAKEKMRININSATVAQVVA